MSKLEQSSSGSYEISIKEKDKLLICLIGRIDIVTTPSILKNLLFEVKSKSWHAITIDLNRVSYFDDFGALVLNEVKKLALATGSKFNIINADSKTENILSIVNLDTDQKNTSKTRKDSSNFIIRSGDLTLKTLFNVRYMVSFLGSVILSFMHVFSHPKSLRLNDTINFMEKTGVNAIPIVALISFLLGSVMAFMSSLQLAQFGANIYVASLVSIAMVSELGPIMTAIVVAGRSGSAFAAEIGTMKISEEVDALFIMGFSPTLFLAVPRIVALIIVLPLLTLFSDIFAIAGGLLVGVSLLDLTTSSYVAQTLKTLTLFEVAWGMSKSIVFAALIAWIGCLRGFQTRGGSDAVGNAATSAVVSSIFLIILFDSFFAVARSYLR
ncbi:MAG: MlaE family lipid ABC transporter permease subunit [Desulfobacterales bacterium]|nr:MlaE family lipid ABC transporter permease subunit [Deltaproteobacteria bacterium]NNL42853.1 MlaE family lipid ABC transporter permease subunit [Desulfobacterales bacterium]